MNGIYSLWTKPFYKKNTHKFIGGFSSLKFFYYSWVISFFQTKKYFNDVYFYTDSTGAELLKPLNLPFTDVNTDFDHLPYDTKFWAMGKMKVYNTQTKPFLHIDYDAFIWEDFSRFKRSPIIVQMVEKNESHYRANIEIFNSKTDIRIPELEYFRTHKRLSPFNMGFFGGSNTNEIQKCSGKVFELVENPSLEHLWDSLIHHNNDTYLNCFVEQLFTSSYFHMNKIKPSIMMNRLKFTHIWGDTKKHEMVEDKLTARMIKEYPEFKEKIDSIC